LPDVSYTHQLPYIVGDVDDKLFPGLVIQVRAPNADPEGFDIQAHLDTGAEYSLFDGGIAAALGIQLYGGEAVAFSPTAGPAIDARWHNIVMAHELLGEFPLRVAFSTAQIRRNILGRNFLDAIQIGFREHHLEFYVTSMP
jgi:hypothetical protein